MKYVWELLTPAFRQRLRRLPVREEEITEIRLRAGRPVQILAAGKDYILSDLITQEEEIKQVLSVASRYSLYAYEEEIRQGFLAIRGGHRLGLSGQMSGDENNRVLKYISSINIRIAHERKGCAEGLLPLLFEGERLCPCLIVSPPGCGKTTLLRDCIRLLSDGTTRFAGKRVAVADERFELSACYQGVCQNDLGKRTDIMAGCSKREALRMLLRSMNPEVLAVDELSGREDMQILREAAAAGCCILATIHGSERGNSFWAGHAQFLREAGFERVCFLDSARGPGHLHSVRDGSGKVLWQTAGQEKESGG